MKALAGTYQVHNKHTLHTVNFQFLNSHLTQECIR